MINILDSSVMQNILKLVFVSGSTIYLIYTFIVFRQISVMKKTLITGFSDTIRFLGLINLFLAGGLFAGLLFFL